MNAQLKPAAPNRWWWFGELATVRVPSESTEGGLSVLEIVAPPDLSVPRHVHNAEDEVFVMLEGEATFRVGDRAICARAGDTLFGPRGVPHEYTVGPEGCRMLFAFTPGANMEAFVRASAVPAGAATIPPADVTPPSPEALAPLLRAHSLAFV